MSVKKAPRSPQKATKKNNDHRAQRLDPTSTSYEMAQNGMVNKIDPPTYTTKNNKSK